MHYKFFLQLFADGDDGGSGGTGQNTGNGNGAGNAGLSYSYEQAEEIANARAERAQRSALTSYFKQQGMSEEEVTQALADFKAKRDANKPDASAIEKERDDARRELDEMKRSNLLRSKGVREEDLDYALFKIGQLVTDKKTFDAAAAEWLKANPKFTGQGYKVVTTGSSSGGNGTGNSGGHASINDAIRRASRK